ncbi:MAG: hypothetical protein ACTSYA_05765 [Candidatus Kariarchaeaceae archaeon]
MNDNKDFITPSLLQKLVFTDEEIKVYLGILSTGYPTLGEVMIVTSLELSVVSEAIPTLIETGFIKTIEGAVRRYYAPLPFLKIASSISREHVLAITSIIQSLKIQEKNFEKWASEFQQEFIIKELREITSNFNEIILEPYIDLLSQIEESALSTKEQVTINLTHSKNALDEDFMNEIKEIITYSSELSDKLEKVSEEHKDTFPEFFEHYKKIRHMLSLSVLRAYQKKVEKLAAEVEENLQSKKNTTGSIFDLVNEGEEEAKKKFMALSSYLSIFSSKATESLKKQLKEYHAKNEKVISDLTAVAKEKLTQTLPQVEQVGDSLREKMTSSVNEFKEAVPKLSEYIKSIEKGKIKKLDSWKVEFVGLIEGYVESIESLDKKATEFLQEMDNLNTGVKETVNQLDITKGAHDEEINQLFSSFANDWTDIVAVDRELEHLTDVERILKETHLKFDLIKIEYNKQVSELGSKLKEEWLAHPIATQDIFNDVYPKEEELRENLKERVEQELEKLKEKMKEEIKNSEEEFEKKISKAVKSVREKLTEAAESTDLLVSIFTDVVASNKENLKSSLELSFSDFENRTTKAYTRLVEELKDAEAKVNHDLRIRSQGVFEAINMHEDNIKEIQKASDNLPHLPETETGVIIGKNALETVIKDLAMRSRREIRIVQPKPSKELIQIVLPKRTLTTHIYSDFDKVEHNSLLTMVRDQPRINLHVYDKQNAYICIRDSEEAIFGLISKDKEPVAIRTANEEFVQFIVGYLNQEISYKSTDISV